YATYNRDNVELVDVRSAPIQEITEKGVRTSEHEYELDAIILATGFDASTGPLLNLGLVGRDGVTLAQHWAEGLRTYLGVATGGFPNLFTITGPQSPVAHYNSPLLIEDHVEWVAETIKHLRDSGATTIEASAEAEAAWSRLTEGILNMTLSPPSNSWYMGSH